MLENFVQNRKKATRNTKKKKERTEESLLNVLKKTLRREFGQQKYEQYAQYIKRNIREAKQDTAEIYNDLYAMLREKESAHLLEMQERLNMSLLDAFYISKNYLMAFVAYLAAFVVIASFVAQMYAIPSMLLISGLFLVKTYEFVVNKFCYVDAHMVLIYKSVLDRLLTEQKQGEV